MLTHIIQHKKSMIFWRVKSKNFNHNTHTLNTKIERKTYDIYYKRSARSKEWDCLFN